MDKLISDDRKHMILIGGRPASGKSHLCKKIIETYKNRVKRIIVLTGSIQNNFYQGFINKYVYDATIDRIEGILAVTKEESEQGKPVPTLLILDDIQALSYQNKVMKQLISNYRHHNLDIIFCLQSLNGVGTLIRNNCDIIFLFNQNEDQIRDQLAKSFKGDKTTDNFLHMLDEATSIKYRVLYINKNENPYKYLYLKVDNIENFKFTN